ncbi:hypothetical protein HD553DRAFT_361312 [Filobasidium floriforme]|uniref:uncharacterized protein n=1 Tax=Filobasidium floriforme TaxID=5210 RepID=UPI001E8CA74D|nr:uncharacterized protein HD553DRAFT_361312 [Filobasidium floriforme]KAH8080940.1 hypothetical protein HD553DRAFT_361312 [Filobasidium floriforme]
MDHRPQARGPIPLVPGRPRRQPYSQPYQAPSSPYRPGTSPNSRMPVPYHPSHPPYLPGTSSTASPNPGLHGHPGPGRGYHHVHTTTTVHHHHYHHSPPPSPSPSSTPYHHHHRVHPYPFVPPPVPVGAFRPLFPFHAFIPFIPGMGMAAGPRYGAGHGHGFGYGFGYNGNQQEEEEGQGDDGQGDERERAFPPNGPRLFPRPSSGPNRAGPSSTRRRREEERAGFEVHHPDGTVEFEQAGPVIEEMEMEEDEVVGSSSGGNGRAGEEGAGQDDEEGDEREGEWLRIEWNSTDREIDPSDMEVEQESMPIPVTVPPSSPEDSSSSTPVSQGPDVDMNRQRPASPSQSPVPATLASIPLRIPATVQTPVRPTPKHSLPPGIRAPTGTPELKPILDIIPESEGETRSAAARSGTGLSETGLEALELGAPTPGNKVPIVKAVAPSSSLPTHTPMSVKQSLVGTDPRPIAVVPLLPSPGDEARARPNASKQDDSSPTRRSSGTQARTQNTDNNSNSDEVADHAARPPVSAGLPSPEPAQVLDRLLEVTGLSARQFMNMLERGEFKMENGVPVRTLQTGGVP